MTGSRPAYKRAMRRGSVGLVIAVTATVVAASLTGCEDKRPSPNLQPVSEPATKPVAPTTQELMGGEQVKLKLQAIPFTMSVPKSWKLRTIGPVLFLEGPTPAGIAQLRLGRHQSPIESHAQRLIEGAKKDAAAQPGPHTLADVRDLSGMKLLETRSAGTRASHPAIDASGKVIAPTSTPLNWKVSVFVPSGRSTDVCEIAFVDMTTEQYEIDKQLLDRILASLEYDATAGN